MMMSKDEIVRQEILEKAQGLFKIYGLKKTTMDEIAAACGKAKSTLYYYFKNKEDVFDSVINMELTSLRKMVKEKVEVSRGVTNKILTYLITFHEEVVNKMNLYQVVKQEVKIEAIEQLHFKRILDFEEAYISRILNDSYDSGEFTKIDKADIPTFSKIIIAAFLGIVRYTIESDGGFDRDKLALAAQLVIPRVFS